MDGRCFLTVFVVSVLLATPSSGLKCYTCVRCGDPFNPDGVKQVDCQGSCITHKLEDPATSWGLQCYRCNPCVEPIDPDSKNVEKVDCLGRCTKQIYEDIRDCNPLTKESKCDEVICTCNTDFCNNATFPEKSGGDSVAISMTTVVFLAASQIMMNLL